MTLEISKLSLKMNSIKLFISKKNSKHNNLNTERVSLVENSIYKVKSHVYTFSL